MTRRSPVRRMAGVARGAAGLVVGLAALATVALPAQVAQAGTDVVTNCASSGPGSLPEAVATANPGDTVTFALSPACATIDLTGTISIGVDVTITGPGAGALTVEGSGSQSVFSVAATATISGLTIDDGGGAAGGGISNSGTLTLMNSTVSSNDTEVGGGIFNGSGAILMVENSTVSGNTASELGAGIENEGTATVDSSTISNNGAGDGGGGIDSEFATLTVENSTISNNTAGSYGGGVYVYDSPYNADAPIEATITNSTLSANSAAFGGDISDDQAPVAIGATIVANSPSGGDCLELAALTDLGNNLSDDSSCDFTGSTDLSSTPAGLDPTGLQDNGGPTQTIALEPGSAAIDHVNDVPQCPAADQRGVSRVPPCDIGAYDTDVATAVVPCTPGTTSCSATVTAPSEVVTITGTKPVTTTATITVSVATEILLCPNFGYSAPVTTLTDVGLKTGTSVTVIDTVSGLPSKKGVVICYQPGGSSPPAPVFLTKCHGSGPVPCYKSIKEVNGSVVATLLLPAGDPRFHIGGETPQITGVSPSVAAPGKKLTIKGVNLSEVTGVSVGGVPARIKKVAPTKVLAFVPAGTPGGVVTVISLAGVSASAAVLHVT